MKAGSGGADCRKAGEVGYSICRLVVWGAGVGREG